MKRYTFIAITLFCTLLSQAQTTKNFVFYKGDQPVLTLQTTQVDSIVFAKKNESPNPEPIPESDISICPDNNHPHMIDMGLPSGTKWACCNINASKPQQWGGYYAWGETTEKEEYSQSTCLHYGENLGNIISGTNYDAAHVIWGKGWVMPTVADAEELMNNCKYEWMTFNETPGALFTASNGNKIFMPGAGNFYIDEYESRGSIGHYWLGEDNGNGNYYGSKQFGLKKIDGPYVASYYRFRGCPIRPINKL